MLLQMLTVLWCFFPRSGFFLFCSEFRPKIKSTNPGISIGDVAKKLGEMWNNLSDGEKQPYNNKAAKLKEKYEKVRRVVTCSSSLPALLLMCFCDIAPAQRHRLGQSRIEIHRQISAGRESFPQCCAGALSRYQETLRGWVLFSSSEKQP